MASIPLLTPHLHTAVVNSGHVIIFDLDLLICLKGQIRCLTTPLGLDREWLGFPEFSHNIWPFSGIFLLCHFVVFLAAICFFGAIFDFFCVFDSGKIEVHASKMSSQSERCITKCKELTFDLLRNASIDLMGQECLWRHDIFHFDLWDCLPPNLESCPQIWCQHLAPKYIILIFQRVDKLL